MAERLRNLVRALGPSSLGAAYAVGLIAYEHRGASAPHGALAFAFAWAAALGLALGASFGALARLRQALLGKPRASTVGATARLLAGWHVAASLVAMAAAPSLASDAWYARGGVRRLVHVLAADMAGPRAVAAAVAAALVAYLFGGVALRAVARGRARGANEGGRRRGVEKACFRQVIGSPRASLYSAAAAIAIAALALSAPALLRRARHARPGVVLVGFASLDGASRGPELTPSLEAFSSQGVAFDEAFVGATDAPLARAAWATGVEARRWRGEGVTPDETLLGRLAAAGYRVAVVGDDGLAARTGASAVGPGLERWPLALEPLRPLAKALASIAGVAAPTRRDIADADDVVVRALRFVDGGDGPFALAVFLPEARRPFAGTCARALDFADRAYRGLCKYRACPAALDGAGLDESDVRQELALKKGALACDDAAFGRLMAGLRERGLDGSTTVVAFGEGGAPLPQGERGPRRARLDDGALRVPLTLRRPGAPEPSRRHELVRDIDLAPTLADLLGLAKDHDSPGRSLAGALRGEPLDEAHAFAEGGGGEGGAAGALGRSWALSTGRHRLVARATRRGLDVELFDRQADPAQERDLSADAPGLRDALRDELLDSLLKDKELTMRFGHVVPRAPEAAPSAPPDVLAGARRDRWRPLIDALEGSLVDRREPGATADVGLSTLAPDPWAPSPRPARRRVTLGPGGEVDETRTALVVHAPSVLRAPLRPGRGARLRVAPAPLARPERPLRAEAWIKRRGAPPEPLGAFTLGAEEAERWVEREIDLDRFAGLDVELELRALAAADGAPAIAWGSPGLTEASSVELPYNVVLVETRGLDAGRPPRGERRPEPRSNTRPGKGWLASGGAWFSDFVAAATRRAPEGLALLAGMRSGELGIDAGRTPPPQATLDAFYARRPPLLAPLLRASGASTLALRGRASPAQLGGDAPDLGFDLSIEAPGPRVAAELDAWLELHQRERFFIFLRLDEGRAADPGEAKADTLGEVEGLLEPLKRLGLERETIVAVVAGAGEGGGAFDEPENFFKMQNNSLFVAAPGRAADAGPLPPAHTTDVAPTLLALEGLAADPRMSGRALFGAPMPPESFSGRGRMTEGRGGRSLRSGPFLYVERDARGGARGGARSALFDATGGDPLRDRSGERPETAERLRDELAREVARHRSAEAAESEALAGSRFVPPSPSPRALVRLRFYGGPLRRRATLRVEKPAKGPGEVGPLLRVTPVGLDPDAIHDGPSFVDAAFVTRPDAAVGFDLELSPSTAPLGWRATFDDRPLDGHAWLAGPYGLSLPALRDGLFDEATRRFAEALAPPEGLSPARDEGVLVLWQELADGGPAGR